jgi:NADH-quinone oxidoreductase subunit L
MVTAGVYLVARCSVLYLLAPGVLLGVAIIGALTAIFAASIALVQTDIKRVLAYSTVSQLGYMFLACGVGAFSAGIFHLATHAFFKALLFLGAGSVIHALGGEQDIRRMGGLKEQLPLTYKTFLVASLAIAGIFPFAGFFSKDEILWAALTRGNLFLWLIGAVTAVMTAFYMFRLLFLVFYPHPNAQGEHGQHAHEAPPPMRVPLLALAVLTSVAGFAGLPLTARGNLIGRYLDPVFNRYPLPAELVGHAVHSPTWEAGMLLFSLLLAGLGIWLAWHMYLVRTELPERLSARFQGAYTLLQNKYYVDEIYDHVIVDPAKIAARWLWVQVDVLIVDAVVNWAGAFVRWDSTWVSRFQSGFVRNYALSIFLGVIAVVGYLLVH